MMIKAIAVCFISSFLMSCVPAQQEERITVAVRTEPDAINPVTHTSAFSRIVCTGILPRLLESEWDSLQGRAVYKPFLAKSYSFSDDRRVLTYHLRSDFFWEDGERVTAHDIRFTFQMIAHPDVASTKKEHIQYLTDALGSVDRSVIALNDSTIEFHFTRAYPLQIFDTNLQPGFLPFHILKDVKPSELRRHTINTMPLSGSYYDITIWKKQDYIVLERNARSPYQAASRQIVFRIIPEYTTRLTALKTGDVDVMYPIMPQDVADLRKTNPELRIEAMRSRYYDYVGWQNIDQHAYHASSGNTIQPHPLFGSKHVRRALTMAIHRQEIVDGFMGEFGRVAITPISPVFRWAANDTLSPLPYEPEESKRLLAQEGWIDRDGDGIVEKNGRAFTFELYYDAGNDRRQFAALIVQRDLKKIGIRCDVRTAETNVFYDDELNKKYDAFISGIGVPLMIDPTSEWSSDLKKNPYNDISYQNPNVDALIEAGKRVNNPEDAAPMWRALQAILHEDQPATFLYWRDELVGYNQKIKNSRTSLLGEIDKFWLWEKVTN